MALSRRIARPLLASMFIYGGADAIRNPASKTKAAEAVTDPLSEAVAFVPNDPELLVRVNGAAQLGAGLLLATGRFRRLASVVLIVSIVPTTYAGHRFWEETDDADRAQQRIHFFKNLGLLGGLILAAVDTEGAPSLGWRARRRAERASLAVAVGRAAATAMAGDAVSEGAKKGSGAARRARRQSAKQSRRGQAAVGATRSQGIAMARRARKQAVSTAHDVVPVVASATRRAGSSAASTAQEVVPVLASATRTAGTSAASAAQDLIPVLASVAHDVGPAITSTTRRAGATTASAAQDLAPVITAAAHEVGPAIASAARELSPTIVQAARSGAALAEPYLASGVDAASGILNRVGVHGPSGS